MSRKTSLFTFGLLVAAIVVATPAFAQLTLPAGEDGFMTPANGTQLDLTDVDATAIFGRGASFGQASVALQGQPINQSQLGNIDTILRRNEDASFSGPGSSADVSLTLLAISLKSKTAVAVNTSSGSQSYNLRVCASPSGGGGGGMTLTQTNSNGGNFDAAFTVVPVLRFTPVGGGATIVADCGSINCGDWAISTTAADWVHDGGGFDPGAKGVAIVQGGLFIDSDCDGSTDVGPTFGTGNFFPGFEANPPTFPSVAMNHDHASYSTYHKVKPPLPPGNGCRAIDAEPTQLDGASLNEATAVTVNQVKAFCAASKTVSVALDAQPAGE